MKSIKRMLAVALAGVLAASLFVGCGKNSGNSAKGSDGGIEKDVVTIWTFPVEKNYKENFQAIREGFESENPNIKLEVEELSWSEGMKKFNTAVNAGTPPDLMFVVPSAKYVKTGLVVPIEDYVDKEALKDYYPSALDYMKVDGKLYGLPLYMKLHTIGGNKKLLEEAGIDWKKIQQEGWTWEEFKEEAKKGTKTNADGKQQYGLVFHGAGGASMSAELLDHMLMNNGLPDAIDKDGNYTMTDTKFLETLQFIRSLIDEGIMPKETNQITPGKRMEYLYSEQAMIVGKSMPYYEVVVNDNNKKVKEGTAPEGQKEMEFVLLPEPHAKGQKSVSPGGTDGYTMFKQKNYKGEVDQEEHLKNVGKAVVALTSGKAGSSAAVLCLPQVTKSGEDMWKDKYTMTPENKKVVDMLFTNVAKPIQINPDLSKKATKIKDEVIIPKFSALLGGDVTADEMYEAVKESAEEVFAK